MGARVQKLGSLNWLGEMSGWVTEASCTKFLALKTRPGRRVSSQLSQLRVSPVFILFHGILLGVLKNLLLVHTSYLINQVIQHENWIKSSYRSSFWWGCEIGRKAQRRVYVVDIKGFNGIVSVSCSFITLLASCGIWGEITVLVDSVYGLIWNKCMRPEEIIHPLLIRFIVDQSIANLQLSAGD